MTGLTRRHLGLLAAAAAGSPTLAWAAPRPPLVIAAGGASAERPEDTRSALDLAIDQGADFLQVNLFRSDRILNAITA